MNPTLGQPHAAAMLFFLGFVVLSLGITVWAARLTRSTESFFAAGRTISVAQNGWALAGDYMTAGAFLGTTGLVALSGFDGLLYPIGAIVGWPILICFIAEPLRNLGRYTFADVVALRGGQQARVRIAAAVSSLAVTLTYLISQMVGAGTVIQFLFGMAYELAIVAVGLVMLACVLFGGMIAATWVQIIKAVLMLGGASILSGLVLSRVGFNPIALFELAAADNGAAVLAPGGYISNPVDAVSLGLGMMLGTAGLPHVLMRLYTVPDARAARKSVAYATTLIAFFFLLIFILGFGAMELVGRDVIRSVDPSGNMATPLLAELLGGTAFLGFIAAVAFSTILAVVAGMTLSGAAVLSHDLWVNVVRRGHAVEREQFVVGRIATIVLGLTAIALSIAFKGQNVVYMAGLALAVAASAIFPALVLSIHWKGLTTVGAQASMFVGALGTVALIVMSPTIQVDIFKQESALFPLRNPGLVSIPLAFAVAVGISLLRPNRAERLAFEQLEHRLHFGTDRGRIKEPRLPPQLAGTGAAPELR